MEGEEPKNIESPYMGLDMAPFEGLGTGTSEHCAAQAPDGSLGSDPAEHGED